MTMPTSPATSRGLVRDRVGQTSPGLFVCPLFISLTLIFVLWMHDWKNELLNGFQQSITHTPSIPSITHTVQQQRLNGICFGVNWWSNGHKYRRGFIDGQVGQACPGLFVCLFASFLFCCSLSLNERLKEWIMNYWMKIINHLFTISSLDQSVT